MRGVGGYIPLPFPLELIPLPLDPFPGLMVMRMGACVGTGISVGCSVWGAMDWSAKGVSVGTDVGSDVGGSVTGVPVGTDVGVTVS